MSISFIEGGVSSVPVRFKGGGVASLPVRFERRCGLCAREKSITENLSAPEAEGGVTSHHTPIGQLDHHIKSLTAFEAFCNSILYINYKVIFTRAFVKLKFQYNIDQSVSPMREACIAYSINITLSVHRLVVGVCVLLGPNMPGQANL